MRSDPKRDLSRQMRVSLRIAHPLQDGRAPDMLDWDTLLLLAEATPLTTLARWSPPDGRRFVAKTKVTVARWRG
jgi:hypothetical protein